VWPVSSMLTSSDLLIGLGLDDRCTDLGMSSVCVRARVLFVVVVAESENVRNVREGRGATELCLVNSCFAKLLHLTASCSLCLAVGRDGRLHGGGVCCVCHWVVTHRGGVLLAA
jgi:hypothetical protein